MNELTLNGAGNLPLTCRLTPGKIEINYDELAKPLHERLSVYDGAVLTEDTLDLAKKDLAELRKLKADIETARKTVKKEFSKPYDDFEKKMKEFAGRVDASIKIIDDQAKAFEADRREKKRARIKEWYEKLMAEWPEISDYAPFEVIYDPRWENKTCSNKTITAEIEAKVKAIEQGVETLKAMHSEKEADALAHYKRTLDLNGSIQMISTYEQNKAEALKHEEERRAKEEEHRLQAEIERAKAAEREALQREEQARQEALAKAQEEKPAEQVAPEPFETPEFNDEELPFSTPETVTAFYKVVATPEELEQVETAFNSFGIFFERRDG